LVSLVIDEIKKDSSLAGRVVDLGSGSGCIAISLATEQSSLQVTAVENSAASLTWLKRNIEQLAPSVRLIPEGVDEACFGEIFDVVVANPPYIPIGQELPVEVRKEPASALFGGDSQGLAIPLLFISAASRMLRYGGLFAMEHHETQGEAIAELLAGDFELIRTIKDLTGRVRFTTARKK
jgi:release factor glutamine methyltransferase